MVGRGDQASFRALWYTIEGSEVDPICANNRDSLAGASSTPWSSRGIDLNIKTEGFIITT